MTKCIFKALKAVDLEKHVGLFRSLGYESAGALAHFRAEHFEKLNFTEQELLSLISLLDVLKEATREGKICPHYFNSNKTNTQQSTKKSAPIRASWSDETIKQRNIQSNLRKQSNENNKPKRSVSSVGMNGRSSSSISMAPIKLTKNSSNDFMSPRTSTVFSRQHPSTPTKTNNQRFIGPKSFLNRPAVQHVKVKSYNYGIPTNRRPRNTSHRTSFHNGSMFISSPRHNNDTLSYAKPAEIYVYARKRPLLSSEANFQDTIVVPDNKRIIITENKANLDCTPLLKKTEFQFDHVFGSNVSNKEIFESTVVPLISPTDRHNLTYICFGQTGSGKSHTIFGSKSTDGLLVYCTQLLLQETVTLENSLICSFYEIYNNQVYDLVDAGKRLFVREDGDHHVNVIGMTEMILKNLDNLRYVIDDGLSRRHHGKSAFNSNSSRSHAVFQIILKNNYDSSEIFRLIFIDLAGSERATDAQNNQRQTRREGAQINWSLLALKECIRSMDMTHSHAPFRQSKLTHILRDSLVGTKTRTCLMATVSPPDDCCQCSLNTLQYASRIRDISMRHRHRSVPTTNIQMNYFDEKKTNEQEKPQKNFKPATASTPVHRLIPAVDPRLYMSTDIDTRLTKPIDIDWQIADDDDDLPISGGGNNRPLKTQASTTREFLMNSINHNSHLNRVQPTTKNNEITESPSSYFPVPQVDIKKSSSTKTNDKKRSFNSSHLMYDDGNERQWKIVPAPTTNRHSNSSIEPSNPTRIIPIAPMHMSDDNPYSSATGTESLGTKITKVANNDKQKSNIIDSLNFNKQYDTDTTEQITPRNQTEFFNNRDELLSILSSRLTPVNKRSSSATTPKSSRVNSPYLNKSKTSLSSSSNKNRSKPRLIKSSSSTTSLASVNQDKKSIINNKKTKVSSSMNIQKFDPTIRRSPNRHHHHHHHQRTVPLRVHHSSDSEEPEKVRHRRKPYSSKNTSYSTRSEAGQTINNTHKMKNEPKQLDEQYFHREQNNIEQLTPTTSPLPISSSSPVLIPSTLVQAPLDQVKLAFDRSLQQPMSPLINNPWPLSTSFSSPSKDFGVRVSDQLNSLRSLLENRLTEQDKPKAPKKELSILQTSPGTFARDFLQSFRQSSLQNPSIGLYSGDDDDDDDKEVERNFNYNNDKPKQYEGGDMLTTSTTSSNTHGYSSIQHHYHRYEQLIQPSLSSLSDELNQARVSSTVTSSSTPTIASNLAAKIDTQEPRISSNQIDSIHPHQSSAKLHQTTSDSERTSQVNFISQNPFTGTSSGSSSSNNSPSHSPVIIPPFSTSNDHDHLFDNVKGSSLLNGSSFDALLNSLKTMREKDLDFIVRTGDDKLIPVAD